MRKLLLIAFRVSFLGVLAVAAPGAAHAATIMFNDGDYHEIDYELGFGGYVYVRNVGCPPGWPSVNPYDPCFAPGDPTELAILEGAYMLYGGVSVYESSTVTMDGGRIDHGFLVAYDSSTVTMNGGKITWGGLTAHDTSTVTMNGGTMEVGGSVYAGDSSTVTMNGGSIGYLGHLGAHGSSTVTVNGSFVYDLGASDFSTVTIRDAWIGDIGHRSGLGATGFSTVTMSGDVLFFSARGSSNVSMSGYTRWSLSTFDSSAVTTSGGAIDLDAHDSSIVTVSGGEVLFLEAFDSSIITIVGSGFVVDGTPVPYGDLTAQTGTLTGTLARGDPINNIAFAQGGGSCYEGSCTGTITLVPPVAIDIKPGSDPGVWYRLGRTRS